MVDSQNKVKFVPDFISDEERIKYIDYINDNFHNFDDYSEVGLPERHALRFGRDQVFWDLTHHDLSLIRDIEPDVRKLFDRVCRQTEQSFGLDKKLYVAVFWLAKQLPRGIVRPHIDSFDKANGHFQYSTLLYLNKTEDGGDLIFPKLKYSYGPRGKDLVMFPSKGDDMIHEVNKITEERYSLLFWLTDNEYFAV
jgi:hypothetical protein